MKVKAILFDILELQPFVVRAKRLRRAFVLDTQVLQVWSAKPWADGRRMTEKGWVQYSSYVPTSGALKMRSGLIFLGGFKGLHETLGILVSTKSCDIYIYIYRL